MEPIVSVIIPNYNHAPFLQERIESVLGQTFQDFELIILDDASTDNSKDVIKNFEYGSRVSHIVINEKNTGSPFLQWGHGLGLARGRYIWIAESDDVADIHFLEVLVKELERDLNAVIAFSHSRLIDVFVKICILNGIIAKRIYVIMMAIHL